MIKKALIFVCIIMCFLLQGCWGGWTDINAGKRPTDQGYGRWVSENPNIYFEVSEKFLELTGFRTYGQMVIDGVTTEIVVYFDYGTGMYVDELLSDGDRELLFGGTCNFSPDKLVLSINNKIKGSLEFDKSIKKITFIKEVMI